LLPPRAWLIHTACCCCKTTHCKPLLCSCSARYVPYSAKDVLHCRVTESQRVEVLIILDNNFVTDGTGRYICNRTEHHDKLLG
jgi:hypothetical protein